jgi:hypothetical protein
MFDDTFRKHTNLLWRLLAYIRFLGEGLILAYQRI